MPLLDNLRAWLLLHRQPGGSVCVYRNMASEINRLVRDINAARSASRTGQFTSPQPSPQGGEGEFKWKHNALRHSFISYRVADIQNVVQVALEAGNSPQMSFKHYREPVRPADAKTWFSIAPGGGKIGKQKAESKKGQTERPGIVVEAAALAA